MAEILVDEVWHLHKLTKVPDINKGAALPIVPDARDLPHLRQTRA